jgi:small subunit ribosomal protein S17
VVKVERKVKHPLYGKIIRRSKKYHAHDENNEYQGGRNVRIEETADLQAQAWKVMSSGRAGKSSRWRPLNQELPDFSGRPDRKPKEPDP